MAGGALFDLEELAEAQSILVPSESLLVQLQLPQSLTLLVAGRAGVLHQVEAGLGGVVAQRAVVDARVRSVRGVLLLQVLRIRGEEPFRVKSSRICFPSLCFQGAFFVFWDLWLQNLYFSSGCLLDKWF